MRKIEPDRIVRAARIYSSNEDASAALGIAPGSFSRLCRRYGIETPYARKLRRWREARNRKNELNEFELLAQGQEVNDEAILAIEEELERQGVI